MKSENVRALGIKMSESKNTPVAAQGHLRDYDLRLDALAAKSGILGPNGAKNSSNPHDPIRTNIRVITIRNVPDDRRMWTAAIPAAICALVALGALSVFQHHPTSFTQTSSHSARSRPSAMQAAETGVEFRTTSPSREERGSLTLEFAGSRSRKVEDDTVGNDTFVDYRHQTPTQSGTEQRGAVLKRVIVYN
jgi:hypothetical protein